MTSLRVLVCVVAMVGCKRSAALDNGDGVIDPNGTATQLNLGVIVEDVDLVTPRENFFRTSSASTTARAVC